MNSRCAASSRPSPVWMREPGSSRGLCFWPPVPWAFSPTVPWSFRALPLPSPAWRSGARRACTRKSAEHLPGHGCRSTTLPDGGELLTPGGDRRLLTDWTRPPLSQQPPTNATAAARVGGGRSDYFKSRAVRLEGCGPAARLLRRGPSCRCRSRSAPEDLALRRYATDAQGLPDLRENAVRGSVLWTCRP